MATRIIWSKKAEKDFDQITDYLLESWSEKVCRIFIKDVFDTIERLHNFPGMYPLFDKEKNIRKAFINNAHYALLFTKFQRRQGSPIDIL